MKKLISTKNPVFISLVGPSETRKSQFFHSWLKNGTSQPKFDNVYFFINALRHSMMLRKNRLKISSLLKV